MRTTVEINDELFRQAKKRAVEAGVPLREIIENALRAYLNGKQRRPYKLRWRPQSGEILPGVDLESRSALYDLMDQDNDRYRY